jgi:hypothetical protein
MIVWPHLPAGAGVFHESDDRFVLLLAGLTIAAQTVASAHFKLLEPASWCFRGDIARVRRDLRRSTR